MIKIKYLLLPFIKELLTLQLFLLPQVVIIITIDDFFFFFEIFEQLFRFKTFLNGRSLFCFCLLKICQLFIYQFNRI